MKGWNDNEAADEEKKDGGKRWKRVEEEKEAREGISQQRVET
jgi:hypothetical protein